MHSERTGSGQTNNSQPQSQEHTPVSGSSAFPVSTTVLNPAVMLSAGQPTVPSGIFGTGVDGLSPSQRFAGGYATAQYQTIYGIPGQVTGPLTSLQPYSSFFPGFGGSGTSGHRYLHSTIMSGTGSDHYPQVESYSAMLASIGSHVQHLDTPVLDRTPRIHTAGMPVSEHPSPFLTPSSHLAAQRAHLPSLLSSSHPRLSSRISSSPGPTAVTRNLSYSNPHQEVPSSHHSQKIENLKGNNGQHARDGETSRNRRPYVNSSSIHEDKPAFHLNSISTSGHIPKVTFDSVVKEYGGDIDCPTGRGDTFTRSSLSGKEGSRKHRILTRPSDSEMSEDTTEGYGTQNEPLSKRPKLSSFSSTAAAHNVQLSPTYPGDSKRATDSHFSEAPTPSYHILKDNNMNIKTTGSNHGLVKNIPENQRHQPSSFQQPESGLENKHKQLQHHSSPSSSPPSTAPNSEDPPSHLQYPSHFLKGSIIQLANGSLKRVEDLRTEDFVNSAEISSDLKVDTSTVVKIEENLDFGTAMLSFSVGEHRVHVTVEATLEHPFFVFGQGWSSCSVSRTLARYGLDCQKLNVGDVCVSLTHKDVNSKTAELDKHQQQQQQARQTDSHSKLTWTTSTDTSEYNIPSPQSSKPLSASSSTGYHSSMIQKPSISSPSTQSCFSSSSPFLSSSIKVEQPDNSIHPSYVSSPASFYKRSPSQTELPPPSSNKVLVKKENNNNNAKKKDLQRAEDELKEDVSKDDDLQLTPSMRKRRLSGVDQGLV